MATPTPKIQSGTGLSPTKAKGPPQRSAGNGTPSPGASDPGIAGIGGTRSNAPTQTKGESDRATGAEYKLPIRGS